MTIKTLIRKGGDLLFAFCIAIILQSCGVTTTPEASLCSQVTCPANATVTGTLEAAVASCATGFEKIGTFVYDATTKSFSGGNCAVVVDFSSCVAGEGEEEEEEDDSEMMQMMMQMQSTTFIVTSPNTIESSGAVLVSGIDKVFSVSTVLSEQMPMTIPQVFPADFLTIMGSMLAGNITSTEQELFNLFIKKAEHVIVNMTFDPEAYFAQHGTFGIMIPPAILILDTERDPSDTTKTGPYTLEEIKGWIQNVYKSHYPNRNPLEFELNGENNVIVAPLNQWGPLCLSIEMGMGPMETRLRLVIGKSATNKIYSFWTDQFNNDSLQAIETKVLEMMNGPTQ